jgi:3-phosphoshikimate 1-carboxyvinyltransferase/3-dehydroquinate synthase
MTVKELFIAIGAEDIEVANKDVHDKMIAYTSQLAHIVSSAYIKNPLAVEHAGFSAGSFKDLTRVARLNPEMWTELFIENKDNLVAHIDEIQKHLTEYRNAIDSQDKDKLAKLLEDGVKQKKASEDVLNARIKKLKDTKEDDTQSKILLDNGLIGETGKLIKNIATGKNILIVSDTNVSKFYLNTVKDSLEKSGYKVGSHIFEAGEQSKNYKTYIDILSSASENMLTRNDCIIALGGGVVSDIAGFAAATYMRGIKYITISTSLLGMVDAAIGGKTGIDTEYGKNLTGCFYQPSFVICDLDTLHTLPIEEYKNGFGEIIKYAVLNENIFNLANQGLEKPLIEACIKFKMDIVNKDEKEGSVRRLLNLGHTFGHAIEKASNYQEKHGEAVVKGLYIMAKAAKNSGKLKEESFDKIEEMISKYGFSTKNIYTTKALIEIIKTDKKMENNEVINLVDIEDLGQCSIRKISLEDLKEYVEGEVIVIERSKIKGVIEVPASKSVAHRAFICAALADKETLINGRIKGDDIDVTIEALNKLGAKIIKKSVSQFLVTPLPRKIKTDKPIELDMKSSGSSLRFLLPIVAALGVKARFVGSAGLSKRPISELIKLLKSKGLNVSSETLPFEISGTISPGKYVIDGSISSQYITGLLLALPILKGESLIEVIGEKVSKNYIDVTLNVQNEFNVNISTGDNFYEIKGNNGYISPGEYNVEGDYSSAAAMFCLAAVAGAVEVTGLSESSLQGDKVVLDILERMGATVKRKENSVHVKKGKLKATNFDAKNCPDLVPVLAVTLGVVNGTSRIYSCDRLKAKESDRLTETISLLRDFGIPAEIDGDTLVILGGRPFGTFYRCPDDHRMAMAATILASVADRSTGIFNFQCVSKSYPDFFDDFRAIGGQFYEP